MNIALRVARIAWLPVALIALWWFASAASTSVQVPPLSRIVEQIVLDFANGTLWTAMTVSLVNLAAGLAIATVVGVVLGLIIGETTRLRLIVDPFVHFFRSIPQSALVPLIIGTLGIGREPKILVIAFATVWPILLNAIDGTRSVEIGVRRVARVFRIPRTLYFRRVVLPGAMPQIVAGIRVALPIGIVVMIVSELFASSQGLGFYILNSKDTFQFAEMWGGALLVGVIGYLLILLFGIFERRVLRWYFRSGAM